MAKKYIVVSCNFPGLFFDGSVGKKNYFPGKIYTAHRDNYIPKHFIPIYFAGQSILVNSLEHMTRFTLKVSEKILSHGFWPWVGRVT